MVFRHNRSGATWIDLEQPTPDELAAALREFNVGERIGAELAAPSPIPLSMAEDGAALLVMHFPTHDDEDTTREQEVDLVAGRDFLLSVRYEVIAPLHALHKSLEAHELLGLAPTIKADDLLELVVGKIFDAERDHAKHVAGRLTKVEHEMFSGRERETVRQISLIQREFLHLESAAADNEDPLAHFLDSLERRSFYGPSFAERRARVLAERDHVARLILTHRKIAGQLQETNVALLNAAQNQIMKTLTVITFIFLPLELIAGIFAMDETVDMPLIHAAHGFWIIIGIMVAIGTSFFIYFRAKRWL